MGNNSSSPSSVKEEFNIKMKNDDFDEDKRDNFARLENLLPKEIDTLEFYSYQGDGPINAFLRKQWKKNKHVTVGEALENIEILIEIFKKSKPVRKDTFVFRALNPCSFLDHLVQGKRFVLDGFVSTTLSIPSAVKFLNRGGGYSPISCMMVIMIPKGAKALFLGAFTEDDGEGGISKFPDEEEVLLPHNSIFIVKNIFSQRVGVEDNVYSTDMESSDLKPLKIIEVELVDEPELLQKISIDDKTQSKRLLDKDDGDESVEESNKKKRTE